MPSHTIVSCLSCALFAAVIALTGCAERGGGDSAPLTSPASAAGANLGMPRNDGCLNTTSARALTQLTPVDCRTPHEGQVYALIGFPAGLTDPTEQGQVSRALPTLACPDVKAWAGYKGAVPLGLFHTFRFPTKEQIAAGARWTACVAIVAPGPDHDTLKATKGSLKDKLVGRLSPLPGLGRCAPSHTNRTFTPSFCEPRSTQWVWLGQHRKPSGPFPGVRRAKKVAHAGCDPLVGAHGGGAAWVYYPDSASAWSRAKADWSCWMPLARVKR